MRQQVTTGNRCVASLPPWPKMLRGTLMRRRLTCGNPGCRCHRSQRHRHGPYWYLSVNYGGRTKMHKLQDSQVPVARQAIDNDRRWWKTCLRIFELNTRLLLTKEDSRHDRP